MGSKLKEKSRWKTVNKSEEVSQERLIYALLRFKDYYHVYKIKLFIK